MTRREFIGALGSSALMAGCEIEDVERLVDDARTDARIGVLANTAIEWKDSTGPFVKALRYFRQEGVDAVVIAGGATLNGYKDQVEVLKAAWSSVFGNAASPRLVLDEGRQEVNGFAFGVSPKRPFEKCEVLTFHGTGRRALTNEMWFHDAENHSVYAGSMSGIVLSAGYEHAGRVSDGKATVAATQGLLVSVYAKEIRIRRLDFAQSGPKDGRRLGRNFVYAEDVADELVLDRQTLSATSPAAGTPEFWDDTRLQAIAGYDRGRPVVTLRWPHVLKRFRGTRAFRYEVGLHVLPPGETVPHAPIARRYVLTRNFHLSEDRDLDAVSCQFDRKALDEVRKQHPAPVITVTPVSSLGARGKAIVMKLP